MRKKLLIMTLALAALLGLTTVYANAASGSKVTLYVNASATTDQTQLTFQTFQEAWTYANGTSVPTTDAVEIVLQSDADMTAACAVARNITVTSEGSTVYTLKPTVPAAVFNVNTAGCSLTLKNVTVDRSTPTSGYIVNVTIGSLYLEDGATLTGNKNSAVYVNGANAAFTMNGGSISNNTSSNGGGVYVINGGKFTMNGGKISNNTASSYGGGVYIGANSTFTMENGEISGNTAGGAPAVFAAVASSSFTMNGGTITGNTTSNSYYGAVSTFYGIITLNDGKIINNRCNALYESYGRITINGGVVASDVTYSFMIYLDRGTLIVNGGTFMPNKYTDRIYQGYGGATVNSLANAEFRTQDGAYRGVATGNSVTWYANTAIIWDNGDVLGGYDTLAEALTAYTNPDTQHIQLMQNVTTDVTVAQDTYLDLNGKTITGTLTVNNGCTLYGFDNTTDGYTGNSYGKISTISGTGTVAAITPTTAAHTTKANFYLKVTEGDEVSFHRFNVQVSDYYFRLVYDGNNANDTGSAMINFNSAVQGDSHVADAITGLELSSSTAGQAEEKTFVLTSDLASLKTALNAENTYYHRSHFIFLSNPYTAQYALKASLDFDIGSGQTATVSSTKDRTLRDILSYFYSSATPEQKTVIDTFLQRNSLQPLP